MASQPDHTPVSRSRKRGLSLRSQLFTRTIQKQRNPSPPPGSPLSSHVNLIELSRPNTRESNINETVGELETNPEARLSTSSNRKYFIAFLTSAFWDIFANK